ncbi:MAG: hypothetical protein J0G35_17475, partial [Acidobacteriales bacterium]|nr:hypothetical protein [Terriglobales bacterium]
GRRLRDPVYPGGKAIAPRIVPIVASKCWMKVKLHNAGDSRASADVSYKSQSANLGASHEKDACRTVRILTPQAFRV